MSVFSFVFTSAGFLIASAPAIASFIDLVSAPSDAESIAMYKVPDEAADEINKFIVGHPLTQKLRALSDWVESRPHLRYPERFRKHSFTAGTLSGHGKMPVPPLMFTSSDHLVSLLYLGTDLCGHVGIVHGGMLATIMDEGLARCAFSSLPNNIGVTAKLTLNYKNPTPAGSFIVLKADTVRVEGRKVWVQGRIELLGNSDEPGKVLVEAEGLFIEPKYAKALPKIFSIQKK